MTEQKKRGTSERFTAEERAAMKERAGELRRARGGKVDDEAAVLEKIAELPEPDRGMAQRLHAIVKAAAPSLTPKLWYGMPAYAKGGKVVCFFQSAQKFKTRYATLGFSDSAALDDGDFWPNAYAVTRMTPEVEDRITELLRRAVR